MPSSPRVSVVIPVYNGGPHLRKAVASALTQDHADLEVVVVDNGSTDGCADGLPDTDPRLRIVTFAEVVPAHENWTRAVLASRGDYVKVLCADDELMPGAISTQVAGLESHPTAVMAAGRRRIIRENGEVLRDPWGLNGLTGLRRGPSVVRACVRSGTNLLGEPAAVLFRGPVLRGAMPWRADAGYVIDLDMYVRILGHGDLWATHEVVSTFRVSVDSWSARAAAQQAADFRTLTDEIARALPHEVSERDRRRGHRRAALLQRARGAVYWYERRRGPRRARQRHPDPISREGA